jgi:flagellar protein FlbD
VIAVTCRNGEHFSVDPDSIERVETVPDTVIHLVDGTKYVVAVAFEDLLCLIRDHRSTTLVARQQLAGGVAEIADRPAHLRVERRARSRDTDDGSGTWSRAVRPDPDED